MDIIHTLVEMEDQFSGATQTKIITTSLDKFNKMVSGIGSTVSHFDKVAQIRFNWKITNVRQAIADDYKS